jgi:hypothetical protein
MAENHSAGTPGPITAGYAADVPQGPGRGKNWNVDTEITAPPPSTAPGIIFSMRSTLTADAAAASYSMIQAMRNPTIHQLGNRFPHHCKVQFLAGAIDQDDQFDWIILPLAPGARTINHYVEWPNVGAPIANTAVQFDYRGYLT